MSVMSLRAARKRADFSGLFFGTVAVGLSVCAGFAAGSSLVLYVAGAVIAVTLIVLASSSWRRAVLLLLAYLPISGIPIVITYPHTAGAVLAKDFLFVLPAYGAFALSIVTGKTRWRAPGAPTISIGVFAGIVAAQTIAPDLTSPYAALIGAKVWLLYIPMFFIGFNLVGSRVQLFKMLRLMTLVSVVPLSVGLFEAALVHLGQVDRVYSFYGGAAQSVTQGYTIFTYGHGASLSRIPSTFSFVSQYFEFAMTSICISYALWRGWLRDTRWAGAGLTIWMASILAALLSGAREAFLDVPLIVLLILLLDRGLPSLATGRVLIAFSACILAFAAIGVSPVTFVGKTWQTGVQEYHSVVVAGFHQAFAHTTLGLGSGVDTIGARYAGGSAAVTALHAPWSEGWYVKAVLELGIPGLLALLAVLVVVIGGATSRHRYIRSPELRPVSSALLAFLVWASLTSLKGPVIDIDPVNVYFWLLAGVLLRVAWLERERFSQPTDAVHF